MKKLLALLLFTMLLAGCSSTPVAVSDVALIKEIADLKADYNNLMIELDNLKADKADYNALQVKYNALVEQHNTLQLNYAVLEAYYQQLQDMNAQLIAQFNSKYVDKDGVIAQLQEEYEKEVARNMLLNSQVAAVSDNKVVLLTANLTATEHNAFYKGWNLWWESFNGED